MTKTKNENSSEPATKRRSADGNAVREEKRRKWLAKQEKKQQQQMAAQERDKWIQQHNQFVRQVTLSDIDHETLEDSGSADALRPYRDLQDSDNRNQKQGDENNNYFIAEGTETVRLLLQQFCSDSPTAYQRRFPPIEIKSIFVKPSVFFEKPVALIKDVEYTITCNKTYVNEEASKKDHHTQQSTKESPPYSVLIGTDEVQSNVVGFPFSRGALAVGVIPPWKEDEDWLHKYLKSHPRFSQTNDTNDENRRRPALRLLALDGICDTANLGSMIRCASAFGVDAMLLSHDCCDAWYRRAVRVSMGHCCRVPCVRVRSLADTIKQMKNELGVESYAAVIDTDSELILEKVAPGDITGAWCCVMGNEGNGVSKQVVKACSKRIRIDMVDGVDSLSVPIATGILLHGLRQKEEAKV